MGQRTRPTADERFWKRVPHAGNGCWEWQGSRTRDGYGSFWSGEHRQPNRTPIMVLAHRWSYERFVATIPDGCVVMHTCDNPPCVNPAHLRVGSQRTNVHDCISKGRHANGRNFLTPAQTAEVRARYAGRYGDIKRLAEEYRMSKKAIASVVRDLPRVGRLAVRRGGGRRKRGPA